MRSRWRGPRERIGTHERPPLGSGAAAELMEEKSALIVRVRPHTTPVAFAVALTERGSAPRVTLRRLPGEASAARWPQG